MPSSAGAVGRFPAIAVKLNGVIASTNPSSGRYSIRFHVPGADAGCSASSCLAKATLYRQKSISSQAASISAWKTDFDWPRIVAAFSVARHGPASRSAARRKTAARSSKDSARHALAAPPAAAIAAATSASVALPRSPRTCRKLCGWTTGTRSPDPMTARPPMVMVSSARWPASSLILAASAARSALPGWYCLIGSLIRRGNPRHGVHAGHLPCTGEPNADYRYWSSWVAYQASSWASAESTVKEASSSPASAAVIASAAAATSGTASSSST